MHTLLFGTLSLQKSIDYECFCKIVKILKKILWLLTHHSRGIPKSFSFGSNRQIQIFSTDFSTKKCFWVFFSAWIEIHVGLQTKTKTQTSLVFEFTRIFLLPFKLKECSWKFVRSGNNESFTVTNRICIFAQFYPFFPDSPHHVRFRSIVRTHRYTRNLTLNVFHFPCICFLFIFDSPSFY